MSRVAKNPVSLPVGVEADINGQTVTVQGAKGSLSRSFHARVCVSRNGNLLTVSPCDASKNANMFAGTWRALLANMVHGVSKGFEKKLEINGVGYRAQVQGKAVNLTLGFSHPVNFEVPDGIVIETPTQTEIIVKGVDKQQVGQIAAKIRAYRPPEPYKGKGIRYANEVLVRKEAKKT